MSLFRAHSDQRKHMNATDLYHTIYVPPVRSSPSELSFTVSTAVAALNNLTDASINAWEAVKIMKDKYVLLAEREKPFRQTVRDLALQSNPKADAFERIKLEAEFNDEVRQRQINVGYSLNDMSSITDRFREVDGMREPCKQAVKSLEHIITRCERAGLTEGQILGGTFLLYVGLGGNAPLPQPRFQYGGGRDYHVLTVSTAKKLRNEIKRRMEIVHAHYLQCLHDIPGLCMTFQETHNETMEEVNALRKYIQDRDLEAYTKIIDVINDKAQEKEMKVQG